ncbi:MAG: hypothetical protein ABI251_03355 [Mycobacteriaceae bacterium]
MRRTSAFVRVAVIVLLALLALNSCSSASTPSVSGSGPSSTTPGASAGAPTKRADDAGLPAGAVVHRDLAYGSNPAQQLDVYQPPVDTFLRTLSLPSPGPDFRRVPEQRWRPV